MATVLKPFLHARNGYTVESLVAGDEREFGAATGGLEAEGYIGSGAPAVAAHAAEEPIIADLAEDEEQAESTVEQPRRGKRK